MERVRPNYYVKDGWNCWDIIKIFVSDLDVTEAVLMFNVLKYLWRFKGKNGVEDLRKAQTYLDKLIEYEVANDSVAG